jgi:hypothetical protein
VPLISQKECSNCLNNLAYTDIDCEFNKIAFLIKNLELCDKYIMQIVSDLSKLTDKLLFMFHHMLIFGSWYVSNSFLFCYIQLMHVL